MLEMTMTQQMKLREFEKLARLVYDQSGIRLEAQKLDLLQARLRKRLKALSLRTFKDYYRFVTDDESGVEMVRMLDCVTTNKTEFFREHQHFEHLIRTALPALKRKPAGGEPLRLWSAACSTGEEVYSLAMTALETLRGNHPIKVLGTDISTKVLSKAMGGVYEEEKVQGVPNEWLSKYFLQEEREGERFYRVGHPLKEVTRFSRFNLNGGDYPFQSRFDVIFCRNVMIYFDQAVQQKLVERLTACLKSGGHLYTGHSESLLRVKHSLKAVAPSVYVKP
jgi:chemotaxis protein methyltransferase CheR